MASEEYIKGLSDSINKFDTYYEASDDPNVLDDGLEEEVRIKFALKKIQSDQIPVVEAGLNDEGRFNYERYFSKANY